MSPPKLATKAGSASGATVVSDTKGGASVAEWQPTRLSARLRKTFSFRNMSAVYLLVVMFVVFAIWIPNTFLTWGTWRSLISDQAITCLVAVAAVPAFAAGVFDLAIGTEVGVGAILVAWLLADRHASIPEAIVLSLLGGGLVGVVNWALIARARIPSFIATLGMSSVLTAVILWVSGGTQILNLPAGFQSVGNTQIFGLQLPVYIMLGVGIVVWYVLERTPVGRAVYAAGADPDGAALAGVRVSRMILCSAVACAVIAGLAGLLESSQLATGDPTVGPGFLLPAIAAVFLGSTQFRSGRMNVWGTVVAAYVIATGVKGLQLGGAPTWIPDLFDGAALLLAVGLAAYQRGPISRTAAIRRLWRSSTRSARSAKRARRAEQLARVQSSTESLVLDTTGAPVSADPWAGPSFRERALLGVSFRSMSAIYLLALMFVVFAIWIPNTFLTWGTWRSLISDQAITCLAALALVPAIAAGVVDLAVGSEVGLGGIIAAWLIVNHHVSVPMAIVLTLLFGAAVGASNWALITRAKIPPFIATLGMSSVLLAAIEWVSGGTQILNLSPGFQSIGNDQILGLQLPVYILLAIALIMWYVVDRTPAGRRLYATGANPEAARLAGIRTSRVILLALIACAVIAGLAGLLESSQLATGDPTIGPGYLLPAIAAVFLGSSQFRNGRVNVWGTVIGAYVIATGVKGLQLAGAPVWTPYMFDGVILILALAMAQYQRVPTARAASIRKLLRMGPSRPTSDHV
jgi:ribose/xylose/arabinose/galactoside ABC-type transport system permease subunit